MKWVALIGIFLTAAVLPGLLRSNRKVFAYCSFVLGLLPFVQYQFHLLCAPISWAGWAGPVKGLEVDFANAISVAIILSTARVRSPTILTYSFFFMLLAYFSSLIISPMKIPQIFFGWEILKCLLFYLAITRASVAHKDVPPAFLTGLITGAVIQAVVAVVQFAGGQPRAGGWLADPNLLGFSMHFVAYPAFAAFLGGYYRKRMFLGVAAALVVAFTGASRATTGLLLSGLVLTALFSCWHRMSGRKTAVIAAAMLGLAVVSPLVLTGLARRSAENRESSNLMRDSMKRAAKMMLQDHPFGVGANKYVLIANIGGYSERAGVPWNAENRSAPVHNAYYLAAAEMGWLGLLALISMFIAGIVVALKGLIRAPPSLGGELAAGYAATFVIIAVHSYFEWIIMLHVGHNLWAMSLGVVAALYATLRRKPTVRRDAVFLSQSGLPDPSPASTA